MNEFDDLLQLSVEEQEHRWMQERLATLSVRESVALTAATLRSQPQNAVDAINCLQSLDHYRVHINTGNYEALGHTYLRNDTKMPQSAMILSCTTPDSIIFSHRLQHHFNPLTVLTLTKFRGSTGLACSVLPLSFSGFFIPPGP